MTEHSIRIMRENEYALLDDFFYEAIYVPEGFEGEVPRSVVYDDPKCHAAIKDFGTLPDDHALVAEADGKIVGACWAGIRDEYGHMNDETPSLSISLYKEYRGLGIGTALIRGMLSLLREKGYGRVSLSVQKENCAAVHVYEKAGFRIMGDGADESEWLMVSDLKRFP